MKAQILVKPYELAYTDIQIPACKDDEVLVKINTSCICNGSDPTIFKGIHWNEFPVVFGHEACGVIVEKGKQVMDFNIGDRVAWWFAMGAFAEYVCVCPQNVAMVKVPGAMPDCEAPILELVGATSRAVDAAGIKEGSRVLIIGLGPSGLIMSQLSKCLKAEKVFGWDLYGMRRNLGLKLGCDKTFDNGLEDVTAKTLEWTDEADVVIDAFGDDLLPGSPTLNRGMEVIKTGGTIISYGHPRVRSLDVYEFQKKNLTLKGPNNDIPSLRIWYKRALEYYEKGELDLSPLITGNISLSQVPEALDLVVNSRDTHLKIIVDNSIK